MNPAKRPDPPDLSTGKENRDISDGTRRLVKPFNHLGELSGTSRSGFLSHPHQILTRSRGGIPLGARTTENSPRVGKPEILATAPDDSSRLSNTLWMVSSANDQIRRHGRSFRGRKPKSGQLLEETLI